MLDSLYLSGKTDILQAIKKNRFTLLQAYTIWVKEGAASFHGEQSVEKAAVAFALWLQTHERISDNTRRDYRAFFKAIGCDDDTTVDQLPALVAAYRKTCQKASTYRMFNNVRGVVSSFLRFAYGRSNRQYLAVREIEALAGKPKRKNRALEVSEVLGLMKAVPPAHAEMIWTLCTTGMRPWSEYRPMKWEAKKDRILVHGEKMDRFDTRNDREIPLIYAPTHPTMNKRNFQELIRETSNHTITPYDFRDTYTNWLLTAGVPFIRVEAYTGHSPQSVTEKYARGDVEAWLKQDAKTGKKWIEAQKRKA